jgi:hypothetical protein
MLGYDNNDGAQALDQQQELDFRRGWQVVDAAGGSNVVTTGTGSFDVDIASGDINTPTGTVTCSSATLDLSALVDPDLPRIVLVYRDASGTAQTLAGTPAPKDPSGETTPAAVFQPAPDSFVATDGVVCASVLLEAGASEVTATQIRDRRLPAEINVESGTFGSLNSEVISTNYIFAGAYDGGDVDARLDNALSDLNQGDTLYLEASTYVDDRTITTNRVRVVGSGRGGEGDATQLDNTTTWTFDSARGQIQNLTGGSLVAGGATLIKNVYLMDITVPNPNVIICDSFGGSVTFESGTSNGIVDTCSGTTVTDNGTNTVGDIA